METIQLNNEFEYLLIQYILKTTNNKNVFYIYERLNSIKKMCLGCRDI